MNLYDYFKPLVIGVVGACLTYVAYNVAIHYEYKNIQQNIISNNKKEILRIKERVAANLMVLTGLKAFYDASDNVTREAFKTFTTPMLKINPDIQALEWVPKVTNENRLLFKQQAIDDGLMDYEMREPDPQNGAHVSTSDRDIYFPVYYVEPMKGNEIVLGLDFPEHKIRLEAIYKAIETGEATASTAVTLTQEMETQKGSLIFSPIYETDKSKTVRNLKGLVLLVLRISDTIEYATRERGEGYFIRVVDKTNPNNEVILFDNVDGNIKNSISSTEDLVVAGRLWGVTVFANHQIYSYHFPMLVLFVGGGFTIFVSVIVFQLTRGQKIIQTLVDRRTQELTDTNSELEEFAYRTSHDLRSPLVSSIALLGFAKECAEQGKEQKLLESIDHVSDSLRKLEMLVLEILELTKVNNTEEKRTLESIEELIDESLKKLNYLEGYDRLEIRKNIQLKSKILTDRMIICMILENLISNAIKYQDENEINPFLELSVSQIGEEVFIEVSDNGLGVPKKHRDNLFKMFKRFHAKTSFGSGLGLYIVEKAVNRLGGTVTYNPKEKGSAFLVTMPIKGR